MAAAINIILIIIPGTSLKSNIEAHQLDDKKDNQKQGDEKYNGLVCTKPFGWFEISWDEKVYPCCAGWVNRPIGKLSEQSPREIWLSPAAKEMRKSVLDGSFKYCSTEFCPYLKDVSYPVMYASQVDMAHYIQMAEQPEEYLPAPTAINCSYDSSCNLACPSCRPAIVMADKHQRKSYDELFNNLLTEFGDQLRILHITGSGDPFASRHFWGILQSGVLTQYPKIELGLHTNAQLLDKFHWDRIADIHQQINYIEISVDAATEATYKLNRAPGDWNLLLQNMDFIAELRRLNKVKFLQLDFVVQSNNWQEMEQFIELGKRWSVDRILFSALNNWGTFSPDEYAARAIHSPRHPEHYRLARSLRKDIFSDNIVSVGFRDELSLLPSINENTIPVLSLT